MKPGGKNMSAKAEKCSVGDKFMQCVYQKIDSQVKERIISSDKNLLFLQICSDG